MKTTSNQSSMHTSTFEQDRLSNSLLLTELMPEEAEAINGGKFGDRLKKAFRWLTKKRTWETIGTILGVVASVFAIAQSDDSQKPS